MVIMHTQSHMHNVCLHGGIEFLPIHVYLYLHAVEAVYNYVHVHVHPLTCGLLGGRIQVHAISILLYICVLVHAHVYVHVLVIQHHLVHARVDGQSHDMQRPLLPPTLLQHAN